MDLVSFVILHYKDASVTDACVQSVLRMDEQERIRIVVVDNDTALPQEKREKLRRMYAAQSRIKVLQMAGASGFSHANNQGYRYAREVQKASYIVVCNNDIEFLQKDFLRRLEASFGQRPCHVLGPDIVRRGTGEHQNPMDTRLRTKEEARYTVRMNLLALRFFPAACPLVYRMLRRERRNAQKRQRESAAFYCSRQRDVVLYGACLIFTPLFVEKEEKAFAPETPFFYEEYILTVRCRRSGYGIFYDPSMRVKHENGAATEKTYRTERERIRFMLERTAEACEIYRQMLEDGGSQAGQEQRCGESPEEKS